ncbi:GNAT family N-acetyltransferase, partial [Providencia rettgeri]|nr:GNAT family N-acetyltransferase [Providencia rettgeri]
MKHQLYSKTISLRLVNESDAGYILSLRKNNQYNKYLSSVNINLQEQIDWITKYKEREKNNEEFYFIIQKNDGEKCGTIRLYDIKNNSFCWGSWILDQNKTKTAAIESALLIYKFGFDILNYSRSYFDVRKDNIHVISFHEKFNAKRINE